MPPGVTMTLELATDGSGAALLAAPIPLIAGQGSGRLAQGVVDVRVLPSGNYVARVSIASAGGEAVRLVAPFSLDRSSTPAARDAGRDAPAPAAAPPGATVAGAATAFRLEEVLGAAVVAPFLDDLAPRSKAAAAAFDHARAGRFADAAGASSSLEPRDPARPFFEGLSLLSRNQLQAASEAFRETLRAAPDYFVGAFYIGACYAAGGRDTQAVSAWQTSLVGLDQYPIVFRLIAEALLRMRQADRAVEILAEASAKWPDDAELRLRLARAALEGRKYDRVTALADAALPRSPADPELLFVGMQAIFEQVTQGPGAAQPEDLARLHRYRDAYVSAGGSRQSLVSEWVAAVEKKLPRTAR
jgi:tetratricopeptide (TPR) repeat protein